jgi:hypothetical protein
MAIMAWEKTIIERIRRLFIVKFGLKVMVNRMVSFV